MNETTTNVASGQLSSAGEEKTPTPPASPIVHPTDAELLIEAARALHATLRLNELYEIVLQVVATLTESAGAVLLLHRPRTHHPIIFKFWQRDTLGSVELPTDVGRDFVNWLEARGDDGSPFVTPLAVVDQAVAAAATSPVTPGRWVALVHRSRVLGAVGVVTGPSHQGARVDSLLVPMAEQVAVALDNALLYRETERQSLENHSLVEAGRMLLSSLDLDGVLDAILDSLQKVFPYNAGGIFLVGADGRVERIVDRGYSVGHDFYLSPLKEKAREGLVGWVATHGQPLIVNDVRRDPRYQPARAATRSEMVVPIHVDDRLVGVFNIERDIVDGFFDADLDFVTAFAQHAGVAIERARVHAALLEQRRIKGELEVARHIQRTFLPSANPQIEGFDIAGVNISSVEVGGDYYDFIEIIPGQIGIAIADVAGKGVPAALIMATFRASLIAEIRNNYALRSIMQKVNRLLCERNDQSRFVTALYGVLDTRNRIFTFSNAGHNPGVLRRADGSVILLKEGGTALGLFEDSVFEERALGLLSGDVIVLYTDGVTEMVGKDKTMFELPRLIKLVHDHAQEPAQAIVDAIRASLDAFADPSEPVDDVTLVVACVR
ncbi:MAG: GAF domain-containing SpoIIE family protein phosphatase [Candidatus Zixiibacteriota bacterium]